MKKIAAAFFAVLVLSAGLVFAQEAAVSKVAVGIDLKKNELVGEAASFPPGTKGVYCRAELAVKSGAKLKLVWKLNNAVLGQSMLEIPKKSDYYIFTYYRRVFPGSWTVEFLDEHGLILAQTAFIVG